MCSPIRLREQIERADVPWFHGGEVAVIEGDDDAGAGALGERDHGGIGSAEGEVGVVLHQLGDPLEVLARGTFDVEAPQATQKGCLGCGAEPAPYEAACLCDDQGWHDEA